MRKRVFGHMRTVKTQISLHTGWSGPSLSANRIIRYYRMHEYRAKVHDILRMCRVIWICAFCTCSKALSTGRGQTKQIFLSYNYITLMKATFLRKKRYFTGKTRMRILLHVVLISDLLQILRKKNNKKKTIRQCCAFIYSWKTTFQMETWRKERKKDWNNPREGCCSTNTHNETNHILIHLVINVNNNSIVRQKQTET